MDQKLHERLSRIELQLHDLREDLRKLASAQRLRGKSCSEVAGVVKKIAAEQEQTGEMVEDIFQKVFPKHGRYLSDIEDALGRAKKKKPRSS